MNTPKGNWKRLIRSCGWVLVGGLAVWLTTENVSAVKPPGAGSRLKSADSKPDDAKAEPVSPDLKQMLVRAEKNHPAIRAAKAKLASARAELDQARLQAAKEVIETQKQWRSAKAVVTTTEAELRAAESLKGDRQREVIRSAKERLKIAREELAAVEVRLALLIGKSPADGKKSADRSEREKQLRKLRAIAQQMVKVATAEWRVGKANPTQLFAATRRLARLDIELATTKREKRDAIEAYVKILGDLQKVATQLYRTRKGSQSDVLAIQYAMAEAELWRLDQK